MYDEQREQWHDYYLEASEVEPVDYALPTHVLLRVFGVMVLMIVLLLVSVGLAISAEPKEGLSPSTCRIAQIRNHTCMAEGYGSGVLVAKEGDVGYVLTAKHVVEDGFDSGFESGFDYVVMFPHSADFSYVVYGDGIVLPDDEKVDIALLKIPAPVDIAPRPIRWESLKVGERLWQSGFGNHSEEPDEYWSRCVAILDKPWFKVSRHTRHGDSGAPVIDGNGQVIGITMGGDGWEMHNGRRTGRRDPYGYHTAIADQEWLRAALPHPERSILVKP